MPIKLKNAATGEIVAIKNTIKSDDGLWVFSRNTPGAAWLGKWPCFTATGRCEGFAPNYKWELKFIDGMGYELVDSTTRKPRKPRKPKQGAPQEVPQQEQAEEPQPTTTDEVDAVRRDLYARYGRMGEDIFAAAVKVCGTAKQEPVAPTLNVKSSRGTYTVKGVRHAKFNELCQAVELGVHCWLWGPAGCGKSELAAQVGRALGLTVYQIGAVKDVYQLRGSFTATGEYIPSTFYKAMKDGGLVIIDEGDAIETEAGLELDAALSQGCMDFPVVGNVKAHKDFRVIFTANTCGMGATEEYCGRNPQDAALLNRVFAIHIDYDEGIEKDIAGEGNADVVEFIHQLRDAAKAANITLIVSYRNIKQLVTLGFMTDADLFGGAITKGMSKDEQRMLANRLATNTNNGWVKRFIDYAQSEAA